jgi:predicted kinase
VHYCQSCEQPTPTEPDDGFAVCPKCGRKDDTALVQPLFVVTGASGSGKTTIFGPLARLLAGRCIVFDVDWLLDASSTLAGGAALTEIPWAGFDQAWLAVAHGVAQSGLPTVLLGTITPDRVQSNVGRKWVGDVHALLLDCPDEIRRHRIESRPSWRLRDVTDQISFGRWLRETITNQVDTSRGTPEAAAGAVVDWIEGVLTAKT